MRNTEYTTQHTQQSITTYKQQILYWTIRCTEVHVSNSTQKT